MSRLEACFGELRRTERTALIPFITAGDPAPDLTVPLMHTLVDAGADIVELGIPFSDPMADGPIIQRANERALRHGTNLRAVLEVVSQFRVTDARTPVVLMGYLNPIESMGNGEFARAAVQAGVDGVIIVDLPPEEGDDLINELRANQIDPVFLIAPTTVDERIERICQSARGFIYYVSLKGVTGGQQMDLGAVEARLKNIRSHTELPVGVGFGIDSPQAARRVGAFADAVIVGSALVRLIEENQLADAEAINEIVHQFVRTLRTALSADLERLASNV